MKENKYFLNTALVAVLGLALLIMVLVRTFAPIIILPELNFGNTVLVSLLALLLDHYIAPNAKRCYICIPLLSAVTFGLLPFAACFVGIFDALKLAVLGGVVFTAVTWLFSSMQDRMAGGPMRKTAPVFSALGLYLAAQCLMGIL